MTSKTPRTTSSPRFSVVGMVRYLLWLTGQIIAGSLTMVRHAVRPGEFGRPSIIEFPLRCATDLEVTWMASSITITPGTLVVGTAHGTDTEPVTLFVHSVFEQDRAEIEEGLRAMEDRLLSMMRSEPWPGNGSGPGTADEGGAA